MEKYKKALALRVYALSFVTLLAVGIGIFDVFGATEQMRENYIFEFQCGFIAALGVVSVLRTMRYRKAIKNEEKLQLLFNKENDERLKAIKAKAGLPMLRITSLAMILGGVIAGYLNLTVAYTLIAASVCQLLVACIAKIIYMKKM